MERHAEVAGTAQGFDQYVPEVVKSRKGSSIRSWSSVAAGVARRPDLWATASRAARSHVPNHWWRAKPWLPVPDRQWIKFRMVTAYGSTSSGGVGVDALQADEVIEWLEWLRSWNHDQTAHGG